MKISRKRNGVILAAGIGSRLRRHSADESLKPLKYVDSIELLIRAIRSLEIADCSDVVVVLGWKAETIITYIEEKYKGDTELRFVTNERYELQNGLSVLCARPYVENEFILMMADHILDDGIMRLVKDSHPPEGGAILCVDYKIDRVFDLEDATKVLCRESRVIKIGKMLNTFNCIDTGIFIGTDGLMAAIASVYQKCGDASLSEGVQKLADTGKMAAVDIGSCFWQDVDTPEMLEHAEKLLKKAVDADLPQKPS